MTALMPYDRDRAGAYAVTFKVQNGLILQRMRALGIRTQTELAKRAGVAISVVNSVVAMRAMPVKQSGEFRAGIENIAGALQCDPDDLFTDTQKYNSVKVNSATVYMNEREFSQLAVGDDMESKLIAKQTVQKLLEGLSDREAAVVMAIAGGATCDEVAQEYGLSRGRIQQIDAKAQRKMKRRARVMEKAI